MKKRPRRKIKVWVEYPELYYVGRRMSFSHTPYLVFKIDGEMLHLKKEKVQ